MDKKFHFEGGTFEIVEEHFHPAGSVKYDRLLSTTCLESGMIFDIECKTEMRQV